ncbi:MAG: uroporphyrinogen decarboxylase [Geminicoccaceae bacterium]
MADKLLLRALRGEVTSRRPVWLMRQAGRYLPEYRELRARGGDFLSVCYNPDLAEEITLQPIRRFGFDAAILFSDILVIPDALGAGVRFLEGEGPQLDPLRDEADLARLDPGRLHGHLEPVYETLRRLRRSLPPAVTLIGFSGAPWTLAAYMVEGSGSKEYAAPRTMARRQRPLFKALIDLLTDAVIAYLDRQVREGAEALQLFDSWAGVLPEGEFRSWCIEPAARIVAELNARHPGVPVICFPRGAGAGYLEFASTVRPQGLSLDTTVPMGWAAASLPRDICLQGNLDPLAFFGTPEAMLAEAARILAATAGRSHVFNLGHGVLPPTDPAMVGRLVAYLQSSGGSLK